MGRGEKIFDDDDDEDDDNDGDVAVADRPTDRVPDPPKRQQPPLARSYANKKIESIEDLYALFPELGDGSNRHYLKLTRLFPPKYAGHNISGHLTDVPNKIFYHDIKATYGGGKYLIQVMGPGSGEPDDNGEQPIRSLKSFEFTIPGYPVPHMVIGTNWKNAEPIEGAKPKLPIKPDVPDPQPVQESSSMAQSVVGVPQQMAHVPMMTPAVFQPPSPPEPPQVQLKKLEIEEKRNSREEERREAENRSQRDVVRQAVSDVKEAYGSQVAELQQRNGQLLEQLGHKDKVYYELQSELAKEKNASSYIQKQLDDISRKYEQLQAEERKLREERSKAIEDVERRFRERLDQEKQRYEDQRERYERETKAERDRNLESRNALEKNSRDEMDRRLQAQKESYEGRIQDLERNTKREIDSVREERDRRIESIRESTNTKLESQQQSFMMQIQAQKSSYDVQMTTIQQEIVRLRGEHDRLSHRNDELQKSQHKDPLQYLQEVTHVATDVLGMQPAGAGGGEGEEFDWKKSIAQVVMGAIDKAPEIIGQAQQMRAQNAVQRQQQQQQQRMNGHPQQPQLGPRQNGRPIQAPAPWQAGGVLAPLRPVNGQARSPMAQNPPPPPSPQQEPQQVPPPMIDQVQAPMQAAPQVMPQAQQVQSPQQPQMQQATVEQMQQMLAEFIGQLDAVIRDGVMPPGLFAKGVMERIGGDQLNLLLQQFPTPDVFFSAIESSGHSSAIITRDGKKYTNELWREAKKLVQQ